MLRPSGAEQIDEKGRQRQVERSRLAALGLRSCSGGAGFRLRAVKRRNERPNRSAGSTITTIRILGMVVMIVIVFTYARAYVNAQQKARPYGGLGAESKTDLSGNFVFIVPHDYRPLNLRGSGLARLPEVIGSLLRNPHVGAAAILDAEPTLDPQRHLRRDCRVTIKHSRQRGACYAQLFGSLGDRQTQGWQHVFPKSLARVGRVMHLSHMLLHERLSGSRGNRPELRLQLQT